LVSVVAAGAAGAAGAAALATGAAVLATGAAVLATVAVLDEAFLVAGGVDGGVDLAEEDFCFLMEGGMVMIIYDVLTLNDFIYQIYSYRD
jgi:hypothetical protein